MFRVSEQEGLLTPELLQEKEKHTNEKNAMRNERNLDREDKTKLVDRTISLGIKCMNHELRAHKNGLDPYTLALVTLANMKYNAGSADAKFAFKTLHGKARKDGKHMYWRRSKRHPLATNTGFHRAAASAEVEMTSYALMSYLHFSPVEAEKIAMWLSRQRNSLGGFASTQDTVVALDALYQFAASAYPRNPADLNVTLMFDSRGAQTKVEFRVSEGETNTRLQSRTAPILFLPCTMHIATSGTGCALVQNPSPTSHIVFPAPISHCPLYTFHVPALAYQLPSPTSASHFSHPSSLAYHLPHPPPASHTPALAYHHPGPTYPHPPPVSHIPALAYHLPHLSPASHIPVLAYHLSYPPPASHIPALAYHLPYPPLTCHTPALAYHLPYPPPASHNPVLAYHLPCLPPTSPIPALAYHLPYPPPASHLSALAYHLPSFGSHISALSHSPLFF
ncbi:alpha-2-macroglobulin-like protein [Plakobranchus ocellatus]|uniref:Alpha-2-macroglobulin-like protein n=1 Tax=Plakobranchus ocellatus TaxID=259542 RepID=A0AAV4CXI2_9GAST|nr:alpha-2-macroglobulin-like protein [Plakobranchus ocellatus]